MSDQITHTKLKCDLCGGRLIMAQRKVKVQDSSGVEIIDSPYASKYVSFTCQNSDCEQAHCFGFLGHTYTVARFGGTWRDSWREQRLTMKMKRLAGLTSTRTYYKEFGQLVISLCGYFLKRGVEQT